MTPRIIVLSEGMILPIISIMSSRKLLIALYIGLAAVVVRQNYQTNMSYSVEKKVSEEPAYKNHLEVLKNKWSKEGGESLLLYALERGVLETQLARVLTDARHWDRSEKVLVMFKEESQLQITQNLKTPNLAFPGISNLPPSKIERVKGIPAIIISATKKEIVLLANLPEVHRIELLNK